MATVFEAPPSRPKRESASESADVGVESLSREKIVSGFVGKEGLKEAQGRVKGHLEALRASVTDPEKGQLENSEALRGMAKELWLLKRVGRSVQVDTKVGKELVKEVNRHVETLAKNLGSGRCSAEEMLALGRLSVAGVLKPQVEEQVRRGVQDVLLKKTSLDRYQGDVSALLVTARQLRVFQDENFLVNRGTTYSDIKGKLAMELEQAGSIQGEENNDARAITRVALRKVRLKAAGLENLFKEASAPLERSKVDSACGVAAESGEAAVLARLVRYDDYLQPESGAKGDSRYKKVLVAALEKKKGDPTAQYLRYVGDVSAILKGEPLQLGEVASADDLEEGGRKAATSRAGRRPLAETVPKTSAEMYKQDPSFSEVDFDAGDSSELGQDIPEGREYLEVPPMAEAQGDVEGAPAAGRKWFWTRWRERRAEKQAEKPRVGLFERIGNWLDDKLTGEPVDRIERVFGDSFEESEGDSQDGERDESARYLEEGEWDREDKRDFDTKDAEDEWDDGEKPMDRLDLTIPSELGGDKEQQLSNFQRSFRLERNVEKALAQRNVKENSKLMNSGGEEYYVGGVHCEEDGKCMLYLHDKPNGSVVRAKIAVDEGGDLPEGWKLVADGGEGGELVIDTVDSADLGSVEADSSVFEPNPFDAQGQGEGSNRSSEVTLDDETVDEMPVFNVEASAERESKEAEVGDFRRIEQHLQERGVKADLILEDGAGKMWQVREVAVYMSQDNKPFFRVYDRSGEGAKEQRVYCTTDGGFVGDWRILVGSDLEDVGEDIAEKAGYLDPAAEEARQRIEGEFINPDELDEEEDDLVDVRIFPGALKELGLRSGTVFIAPDGQFLKLKSVDEGGLHFVNGSAKRDVKWDEFIYDENAGDDRNGTIRDEWVRVDL